ncbi:MAG TPA: hypothetical protein VMI75_04335 [Polyangiaceae bacterium]|nr:hypothetical protein [Polyangiaceae bacterium]
MTRLPLGVLLLVASCAAHAAGPAVAGRPPTDPSDATRDSVSSCSGETSPTRGTEPSVTFEVGTWDGKRC